MEDSILKTIRSLIGGAAESGDFDIDIITAINSALTRVNELGIGQNDFSIMDDRSTWDEFLEGDTRLNDVKTYVYYSVKLDVDPPNNSSLLSMIERKIDKLEWLFTVKEK